MHTVLEAAEGLLRHAPQTAIPLTSLHDALRERCGASLGGIRWLEDELRSRPDLFLLLEEEPALWGALGWYAGSCEEYKTALQKVGVTPVRRVVLAATAHERPAGESQRVWRQLQATLISLWAGAVADKATRQQVERAILDIDRLRGETERQRGHTAGDLSCPGVAASVNSPAHHSSSAPS